MAGNKISMWRWGIPAAAAAATLLAIAVGLAVAHGMPTRTVLWRAPLAASSPVHPAPIGIAHTSGLGGGKPVAWRPTEEAAGGTFLFITKCTGPGEMVITMRQGPTSRGTARQHCPDAASVTVMITLFDVGVLDLNIDVEPGTYYEVTIRQ